MKKNVMFFNTSSLGNQKVDGFCLQKSGYIQLKNMVHLKCFCKFTNTRNTTKSATNTGVNIFSKA